MEENEEDFLFSGPVAHLKQMALDPLNEEEEEEQEQEQEISLEPSQRETATIENVGDSDEEGDDEDDGFEFAFVPRDPHALPLTADEMFFDGQICSIWLIFNHEVIFSEAHESDENSKEQCPAPLIHLPMCKILTEESGGSHGSGS